MSRYLTLFVVAALFLLSSTALPQTSKTETDKWREDLAFMSREMEVTHKNLFHTMTRQQFEATVKKLDERMPQLQRHQIIVEMMKIVAMVDDGHSNIYPTRDAKIGFNSLPVRMYLFSDGMFIRSAPKEHASLVGAKVTRIGPATVEDAIARISPLIGRDSEMGLKFFAPYLLAMPEVLEAVGLSESIERAQFTIERAGKSETITLKPAGPVEILPADTDVSWMPKEGWMDMRDAAAAPSPLWLRDAKNMFWYEYLADSKVLYTQINQVGNKQDESLEAFSKRLTAFIDANPVDKLVIDLRLNRGGNGELLKPLEVALIKSRIDKPGKLFVLHGRSTWSAAQFFLNWMEKYSNAIFIGEPSASRGNVYGDSRRIYLPNSGITVRVSVYYWQDWAPWDMRQWFPPTITAEMASSDYRTNRDPVLAAATGYTARRSLASVLDEALAAGGIELAVKRFREWKLDPQNKYGDTEQTLLEAGDKLLSQKKPTEALELFKLDIAENPHSFRGYFAAGVAHAQAGNKDLAITHLKKALELNPKSYDAASYLKQVSK